MTVAAPPLLQALACVLAEAPGPEAAACSAAVKLVLNGEADGLDEAFGLQRAPGERHWRKKEAHQERDRLIRLFAATYYDGRPIREAAEGIATELSRFHAGADWRHSRSAKACPFSPGRRAELWAVFHALDHPLGFERIRKILGG